ncbi:hypothetical protein K474DRAFT_1605455 [Panus rudis PR-1116 ss-1]|nr:hypothetical protein K474DRAFT_1605455 [Panus rudis PR-1116 ss-1]
MADQAPIQLPNPLTPLAWLPPDIASQLEASRYLYSAVMGAYLWDCLTVFPDEIRMFRLRFALPDVIYILSKCATLAFVFCTFLFQGKFAPVGDCHKLAMAIGWTGGFGISLNSLLFFFRVRAVFNQTKIIIAFFALTWLATFGCAMTIPFSVDGVHIGTTKNCVNSDVKPYASAGMIVIAVNDTLVVLAISGQLMMHSLAGSFTEKVRAFFSGKGMGVMSRSILHTGQQYYLATVGVNIVSMAVILAPSVPPVFRAMFAIPNFTLQNAMATRVFRMLKLGLLKDFSNGASTASASQGPSRFLHQNGTRSAAVGAYSHHSQGEVENISLSPATDFRVNGDGKPINVNIRRETEIITDHSDNGSWKGGEIA